MSPMQRLMLQQAMQQPAVQRLVQWAAEGARRSAVHAEPGEPWPDQSDAAAVEAVQLLRDLGAL